MKDEGNVADYMASLNRARRRRRNRPPYGKYALAAAVVCVAAAGIFFGGRAVKGYMDKKPAAATETSGEGETGPEAGTLDESALAAEEASRQARDAERLANAQAVVDSYANIGVVQVSGYLNMRKKPESGSQVVGKLMDGSACEVQETLDGWYHVNSGGIDGYVSSEYVITGDAAKEKALSMVTDRAVVTTDNLNIREQPSTDSNIVGQCLEGERYEILGEEDGWYQIEGGYVSSDYVAQVDAAAASASGKGSEIAQYAQQYVGYPYVYGGSSPSGFDCSGFTMYVYSQHGYSLPHSATSQWQSGLGTQVYSISELQPGDLVFFQGTYNCGDYITHVGIYVGDNRMYHAGNPIGFADLTSAYWQAHLVCAGRVGQ